MSPLVELLLKASALLGLCLLVQGLVPARFPAARSGVVRGGVVALWLLPLALLLPPLLPLSLPVPPPAPVLIEGPTRIVEPVLSLPEPEPRPSVPWWMVVYGVGCGSLLVRFVRDHTALRRLVGRARRSVLAASFPVRVADTPTIPLACGVVRRTIVLPEEALGWSEERLGVVLQHESAHLSRHDPLWQALTELLCALWWFHPLVWALARRLRVTAEAACDRRVLDSGVAPVVYAQHLLEVAKMFKNRSVAPAMAQSRSLEDRLKAILAYAPARPTRQVAIALTLTGVLVAPTVLMRPVAQAQTTPEKQAAEKAELARRLQELETRRLQELEKQAHLRAEADRQRELALKKVDFDLKRADQEAERRKLDVDKERARANELRALAAEKALRARAVEEQRRLVAISAEVEAIQEELEELKLKLRDLDKRLTDKQLERVGNEQGPENPNTILLERQIRALQEMIEQVRQQRAKLRAELNSLKSR